VAGRTGDALTRFTRRQTPGERAEPGA
jgi:hypothetical protein